MAVQTQIQTRRGTAASWTSTNPTLAAGEIGFESDTGKIKIGTGSTAWNALTYTASSTAVTYLFNATAGQTTFSGTDANGLTLAYTVGSEQVYLNGVLQVRGSDYTATNGTSIVLTSGAIVSDVLNVIAFSALSLADTYTQAQANALFIPDAIVDAKGDIIVATAADTVARLAVGTQNQNLAVDTGSATGLKWQGGAWITWSPTIGNISIGNGTVAARYQQTGNVIFFSVKVTFGSTTTISGSPSIPLPVVANSPAYFTVNVTDSGVASYTANGIIPSSVLSTIFLDLIDTTSSRAVSASFSSTSPFTWGTNDNFTISGSYEVA